MQKIDAICSPVILEQWFSTFLFLPCNWLEPPFPATTTEGGGWSYILPCRRIWNKPVVISEPQGKDRVIAKQRKLCLTSNKWFMSLLSKRQQTSVSKKGCWCWISIFDATQKIICSAIVLNKYQNFIASWSTFINLKVAVFPLPPAPDYFRNQCGCSVSSPGAGFCKMVISFHALSTITTNTHIQQQWPKSAMKSFNTMFACNT